MRNINTLFSMHFIFILMLSCGSLNPSSQSTSPVDHGKFDVLLKKYVNQDGMVNYKGLAQEREALNVYLSTLTDNPPNDRNWSKNDQIAYWINVYNAFTLDLILDHYPIKGIKEIGSIIQIPFVNTPWDIKFIEIEGEEYDLNNIEHNILRKNFEEPRIHFAIVCASLSCPKLRTEAYTGEKLDGQLEEQAREFLADQSRNNIEKDKIEISKIFSWFKGDFTKNGTLIQFLNQFSPVPISEKAKVTHMKYDWSLNDQM